MGAAYASTAHHATRPGTSPDPASVEQQLVLRMSALQSHDGDSQEPYMESQWNSCFGTPAAIDAVGNYTLHPSPAIGTLRQQLESAQSVSAHSSPRGWDSPEQLGHLPSEAATEQQLRSRYQELDPRLNAGYLTNGHSPVGVSTPFPMDVVPTETFPAGSHAVARNCYPSPPESGQAQSPCSTTLRVSVRDSVLSPPSDELGDHPREESVILALERRGRQTRRKSASGGTSAGKTDKDTTPYAKLIHRAFLSTPRRAMTLQELYQWFRENTDKGKDNTKGWQNSIRHNLSMNQAFSKRDRIIPKSGEGEGGGKKTTEWYLETWAEAEVLSTTRYRKLSQSRRSALSQALALTSRAYRGYPTHLQHYRQYRHHHSSGRRVGVMASAALPLRVLRGSRHGAAGFASRRSPDTSVTSTMPAAFSHFSPLPPHHATCSSPFVQQQQQQQHHHQVLLNSPYGDARAAPSPVPFTTGTTTAALDYDPQLFTSTPASAAPAPPGMARSLSESGCPDVNEPMTPGGHQRAHPYHFHLDHRQRQHHHHHQHHHQQYHPQQYRQNDQDDGPRLLPYLRDSQGNPVPLLTAAAPPSPPPATAAGAAAVAPAAAYDGVVDRYHMWGDGTTRGRTSATGVKTEMDVDEASPGFVAAAGFHHAPH